MSKENLKKINLPVFILENWETTFKDFFVRRGARYPFLISSSSQGSFVYLVSSPTSLPMTKKENGASPPKE